METLELTPRGRELADVFFEKASLAGCPKDQAVNFFSRGVILQPKQLQASARARECDKPGGPTEVGFGGSRGGGKSHFCVAQLGADDCKRQAGLKCLFLRSVGKAATESLDDLRMRALRFVPHKWAGHKGILYFPNGSRIIVGHFHHEKDIDAYLGLEYDVIAVEEATTLTTAKIKAIRTCCRTSKPNWRPRMYLTTNPGGVSHGYFKRRFIDPFRAGNETETRFIGATVDDNEFLNEDYVKTLDSLTGWLKKAWRFGEWDIAAGQFFTNFSERHHVADEIDDRKARQWFLGLDYGMNHPTVAILGFFDGDGDAWIVEEHGERMWLVPRHAAAIKSMIGRHQMFTGDKWGQVKPRPLTIQDLAWVVAGTDVFSTNPSGRTVAQEYKEEGIILKPAYTDRINGAAFILKMLGDPENPQHNLPARLHIHRRCVRTIAQLSEMQHDPNRPEDVLKVDIDDEGQGGDDCFIAGTPILTQQGERPIEQIRPGDMVLTRAGWRPVVDMWNSRRKARLMTVTFSDGGKLTGTPNHPVWVKGKGFTALDGLRYGDTVLKACENTQRTKQSWYSTVSSFGGIPSRVMRTFGTIFGHLGIIAREVSERFTLKFGNHTTDHQKQDGTSTTKTGTLSIMRLRTWSALRMRTISGAISKSLTGWRKHEFTSTTSDRWRQPGMEAKKGERGMWSTGGKCGKIENRKREFANNAEIPTRPHGWAATGFVPTHVNRNTVETAGSITKRASVRTAEKHSRKTSIRLRPVVPVYVLTVTDTGRADTYAIHVGEVHEYYAAGVLVKNCYDSLRYALAQKQQGITTQKLKGF